MTREQDSHIHFSRVKLFVRKDLMMNLSAVCSLTLNLIR